MSGRVAHQPAGVKPVATAAVPALAWFPGQTVGHVHPVSTVPTIVAPLPDRVDPTPRHPA